TRPMARTQLSSRQTRPLVALAGRRRLQPRSCSWPVQGLPTSPARYSTSTEDIAPDLFLLERAERVEMAEVQDAPAGRLSVPRYGKVRGSFAGDVDKEKAEFMADSQVPWGVEALRGTIKEPAWKTKPSWYLVATDDKMIPPPAQQFMSKRAGSTVVEVKGSHAVYVSKPEAVAALIEKAAKGVKLAAN